MKVIDLIKQLQILIATGHENLECYISLKNTPPILLEVVDIQEGKCVFCDSWTSVFEEKNNKMMKMNTREILEQKLNEYGNTPVDKQIDEEFLDTLWQNRYVYIYLYGKFINQKELEYIKQVLANLNFKPREKYISNPLLIHEILELKRLKNNTAEETVEAIKKLNKTIGENL